MKILENKLINKAELARQVWPDKKSYNAILNHKTTGYNGKKFTDSDKKRFRKVLKDLAKKLLIDIEKDDFI